MVLDHVYFIQSHSNTLTILKAKHSKYVFGGGGFTTVKWDKSNRYKSDPNAFIFSLTNKDNNPLKMKVIPDFQHYAIRCEPANGPTFYGGIIIIPVVVVVQLLKSSLRI
jgi:hypothetical protein